MKIVISHGSGGIGSAETFARDFFESKGYDVHLIDYFTPHGIDRLRWSEREPDNYNVTFKEMFNVDFPEGDLVHIGFSLGAFLGIVNHAKFVKNYLFYPGILGITQEMLDVDYSNASVITCGNDKGKYKYEKFKSLLKKPPLAEYMLPYTHHAFMIEDINFEFNMVRYNTTDNIMSSEEFSQLKPNHKYLSERYGHTTSYTHLLFDKEMRWQYLNHIEEDINETFPSIRKRNNLHENSV